MAFSLFSYFFKRVVENMAASFKDRYRRNKETLEWYDALAMAVAVIALAFTFGAVSYTHLDVYKRQPYASSKYFGLWQNSLPPALRAASLAEGGRYCRIK